MEADGMPDKNINKGIRRLIVEDIASLADLAEIRLLVKPKLCHV